MGDFRCATTVISCFRRMVAPERDLPERGADPANKGAPEQHRIARVTVGVDPAKTDDSRWHPADIEACERHGKPVQDAS